jgi:hypothetical protein
MLRRLGAPLALVAAGWLLPAGGALAAGNDALEIDTPTGASAATVDPGAVEPATIDGFRSARFGMTEEEVRAAIAADFGLTDDAIEAGTNAVEKTTSLGITVDDLVPDGGPARIVYILGYRSKALIQVNIVWGALPGSSNEAIQTAANLLVNYFRSQNYDPEKTAVGVQLANGALLAFYTEDADGSSITLTLASRPTGEPAPEGSDEPAPEQLVMQLSYVGDFANPDIFRLEPGSF